MMFASSSYKQQTGISYGAFLRYVFLPGIIPRTKRLIGRFRQFFFMFIQMLGMARLIPTNHPALMPGNIGHYRIIDVFLIAYHNTPFTRRNLPQIGMLAAIFLAYVLSVTLVIVGLAYVFMNISTAQAQYFSTPNTPVLYNPNDDWAFQFLEQMFGGRDQTGINFWAPNETAEHVGNPWLTALFVGALQLYSKMLLFIAVIMILYIVVVALVDASRSGQPFGETFDPIWAPIRFAIALGLLFPVVGSYNGAQLVVFQAAEYGSNMATNIWHRAIEMNSDEQSIVAAGVSDTGTRFVRDMLLVNLCYYGYSGLLQQGKIKSTNSSMSDPKRVYTKHETIINFGNKESSDYCGTVVLKRPIKVPEGYLKMKCDPASPKPCVNTSEENFLPNVIIKRFASAAEDFIPQAGGFSGGTMGNDVVPAMMNNAFCARDNSFNELTCKANGGALCSNHMHTWFENYWKHAYGMDQTRRFFADEEYKESEKLYNRWITESLKKDAAYGWMSAGVFYLRMGGALSAMDQALSHLPRVSKLPTNIYRFYATPIESDLSNEKAVAKCGGVAEMENCSRYEGAVALNELLKNGDVWFRTSVKGEGFEELYARLNPGAFETILALNNEEPTSNIDVWTLMSPIYSLVYDHFMIDNKSLHPLGEVIAWGKLMMDASQMLFKAAAAFTITAWFVPTFAMLLKGASSICMMIGQFLVLPGYMLMFVVPLMPFLYFTYVAIEWMLSVIEAVIGIPLWVLTFITAKGSLFDGAMNGLKSLFEIILRPTIIVMSLLVSILIFSAGVKFFGEAMRLYARAYSTSAPANGMNFGGEIVAGFGMILAYVFGIYLMANSCFKLIDAIPHNFGRWGFLPTGFGGSIGLSNAADEVASGAALVATKGLSMATSAASGIASVGHVVADTNKAHKDYTKWRASEYTRTKEANREIMAQNETIRELNKTRLERGESELSYLPYQKMPKALTRQEVFKHVISGDAAKAGFKSHLDYFKDQYGGKTYGAPVFRDAVHIVSPPTGSPPAGSPPPSPPSSPPKRDKRTEEVKKALDVNIAVTHEQAEKAFQDMGLEPNATHDEVKKRYNEMSSQLRRMARRGNKADQERLNKLQVDLVNIRKYMGWNKKDE